VLFTNAKSGSYYDTPIVVLKGISGLQGFIMPLTRIMEPFFYTILAKRLKELCFPCMGLCQDEAERLDDLTFLQRGVSSRDLGFERRASSLAY